MRPIVVMGVSGSGKSTVGAALAQRLGVPFADADDFHPAANIAKMTAGIPLDDDDRAPWLDAIGFWLAQHCYSGGVMSCSALKRKYRDQLRRHCPVTEFVHLSGSPLSWAFPLFLFSPMTASVSGKTDRPTSPWSSS